MLSRTSLQGQHSIGDRPCQSPGAPDPAPTPGDRRVAARYGAGALQGGFTAVPNLLLRHYRRLGLSAAELVCIQQLLSFWWEGQLPRPAVATIAERMGTCVRQVQHYLACLRSKGLLRVVERQDGAGGRLANAYDLGPLLAALAALAAGDEAGEAPARGGLDEGAQGPAGPAVQESAPKEDAPRLYPDRDLDSTPQPPGVSQAPDEVREMVLTLGRSLGDGAPASSVARVRRLLQQAPPDAGDALSLLDEARARTEARLGAIALRRPSGAPNAMPYLLATFGSLLRQGARPRPGPADERDLSAPARVLSAPCLEDAAPAELPPPWRAALEVLRRTLPAAVVARRLLPLRAVQDGPAALRLPADTAFERMWLERAARAHIERALAECGHGDVRVEIVGPEEPV